jgi:RNA polymerase sigma-70 factor (ECF subfamily)
MAVRPIMPPTDIAGCVTPLIPTAQRGSLAALGQLFEWCQPYLRKVADEEMEDDLRARTSAADLVQETFAEAVKDFAHFRGTNERELLAWLRRILLHNMANARRALHTDKRQVTHEVALADLPPGHVANRRAMPGHSPSSHVRKSERREKINQAIALLPDDYQQVLQLVFYDRLPWDEVARLMGRSVEAARQLRGRAVRRLTEMLGDSLETLT